MLKPTSGERSRQPAPCPWPGPTTVNHRSTTSSSFSVAGMESSKGLTHSTRERSGQLSVDASWLGEFQKHGNPQYSFICKTAGQSHHMEDIVRLTRVPVHLRSRILCPEPCYEGGTTHPTTPGGIPRIHSEYEMLRTRELPMIRESTKNFDVYEHIEGYTADNKTHGQRKRTTTRTGTSTHGQDLGADQGRQLAGDKRREERPRLVPATATYSLTVSGMLIHDNLALNTT